MKRTTGATIFCLILVAFQCAVFRADHHRDAPADVQEHRFAPVTYEMVNWENRNAESDAGELLIATLGASVSFRRLQAGVGDRDWFVQIILEEYPGKKEAGAAPLDRPARFIARSVNGVAFGQTFFIFPLIRYLDRTIRFAVWRGGELQKEYVYKSDAWVVIGWVSILFVIPSEAAYLRYDMARVARQFAADAARDGFFSIDSLSNEPPSDQSRSDAGQDVKAVAAVPAP